MSVAFYQLKKAAYVSPIPWEGLSDWRQKVASDNNYWVNANTASVEEIEVLLKQLNVHPLLLVDFLNPEHSTLVDRYPEATYMELPANVDAENSAVAYLSIICLSSMLITMQRGQIPTLSRLIMLLEEEERLEIGNTSNLLYKIIDYFIDRTVDRSLIYRRQINRLEDQQQGLETMESNELADLRRHLKQLENISADQLYCSTSLVTHRHKELEIAGQEVYFNDLVTDSEHALRSISRLTDRLRDLQDHLELQHQDSTEKRLRILTILSAIFLPLSFITGFFGMNFVNMRVLEWEHGLLFFTAFMIALSLIMMGFFYRNGWFD
jgi:magnesium transporter